MCIYLAGRRNRAHAAHPRAKNLEVRGSDSVSIDLYL